VLRTPGDEARAWWSNGGWPYDIYFVELAIRLRAAVEAEPPG
jgi:hypothetical protein